MSIRRTLVSMVLPVILAAAFHNAFPTFDIVFGVVVLTAALLVAFTPAAVPRGLRAQPTSGQSSDP
jgi:hypothetical protein